MPPVRASDLNSLASAALLPAALIFAGAACCRRLLYRCGLLATRRVDAPVIVVGGITAGGGGKSPTVQALVAGLAARGIRAGIIARGYGGSEAGPLLVRADSDPDRCGDEPVMHASAVDAPVCIGADRPAAARLLLERFELDALVSDDGLQHYRLERDFEIACISQDAFGNGRPLPAGPLREPVSRLAGCDAIVRSGGQRQSEQEHELVLTAGGFASLADGSSRSIEQIAQMRTIAIAGIARPEGFFASLRSLAIEPLAATAFPDHHRFRRASLERLLERTPDAQAVLMTAKDAVKCRRFSLPVPMYSLQMIPALPDALIDAVARRIRERSRKPHQ